MVVLMVVPLLMLLLLLLPPPLPPHPLPLRVPGDDRATLAKERAAGGSSSVRIHSHQR